MQSPILQHLQEMIDGGQGTGVGGSLATAGMPPGSIPEINRMSSDFGKSAAARAMLDYRMANGLNASNVAAQQQHLGNNINNINQNLAQQSYAQSMGEDLRLMNRQQDQHNAVFGTISPIISSLFSEAF